MRSLIVLLTVTGLNVSVAEGHHKPGHPMPPGQAKKFGIEVVPLESLPAIQAPSFSIAAVEDLGWQFYFDEVYEFEIDLPLGLFEVDEGPERGLHLYEPSGLAEIQVYGADNPRGLSPRAFVTALEDADRVAEVTYRAEGQSWFVLSGYYADDEDLGEPLIFYTKFMFSADRTRVSAFEISYPLSERRRFDSIVTRLEKSLTPPS